MCIGETEVIMEKGKGKVKRDSCNGFQNCICFHLFVFGTAFTIMAFHIDIGINKVL